MANILMVNVPYSGHTNPTVPLTRFLVERVIGDFKYWESRYTDIR